jgi:hypothetical protein
MIRRFFQRPTPIAALLSALAMIASAQAAPDPPAAAPSLSAQPAPAEPPAASVDSPASTPGPVVAPPVPVEGQTLSQLDLFSTGREAGLGTDVWKGASADLARSMIPTLATRPLSPAGEALARRLLAQTATAPEGAGGDMPLATARARALMTLGDAEDAATILGHTPGVADSGDLSQLAAEAALISDQNDLACAIAANLTVDRQAAYWLRLRTFCQVLAGHIDEAKLTFTLAGQQGRDPVFTRLMSVVLATHPLKAPNLVGDPGPASLSNGLNYALSRTLKLDLRSAMSEAPPPIVRHVQQMDGAEAIASSTANDAAGAAAGAPPPAESGVLAALRVAADPASYEAAARIADPGIVQILKAKTPLANPVQLATAALAAGDLATAQAIRAGLTTDAIPGAGPTDLAILDAALAAASGRMDTASLDRLVERGGAETDPGVRARAQSAAAIFAGLGGGMSAQADVEFAGFDLPRAETPPARLMALNLAATSGLKGQTALFVLAMAQAAGAAGPAPADRAWIVQALNVAGLKADAADYAVEGLIALQSR